ncbi:MAG: Smr/MutS family protein [Beijerinckiaceae bacterium]|nr:Smr/MutS family protein [Beijerinckiaceae bacterium]
MAGGAMKRVRALTERERALWAHVAKSVLPIKRGSPPATVPMEALLEELVERPGAIGPAPSPAAPPSLPLDPKPQAKPKSPPLAPIERRLRQRLARGQRAVDAKIDLHGLRQDEAHAALMRFVERAHHDGASLVLVVTGKGGRKARDPDERASSAFGGDLGSSRGVLHRLAPLWLADPAARRFVIGFETAAANHGGSGALYVRIRKSRG